MKTTEKSAETKRNLDQLISKFSEIEILNPQSMSYVRGGTADGEGDGGASVIIKPKF
jgi:hypothetical protein